MDSKKGLITTKTELIQINNQLAYDNLAPVSKNIISTILFGARNTDLLIELDSNSSISNCLEASPISMQIKSFGRSKVAQALDLQVTRLSMMMNVKHNITAPQVSIIVNDLLELYPHESIEDWILVFKRMRQGYYGPSYHQLSLATIIECMKLHLDEKWAERERLMQKEKLDTARQTQEDLEILKAYQKLKEEGFKDAEVQVTEDESYRNFKNDYLIKHAISNVNQIKSSTEKDQSGRTDEIDNSNE